MKTQIIQKLLDERHITAEEALILLKVEKEYVYYPYYPNYYPATPVWTTLSTGDNVTFSSSSTSNWKNL